MKFAPLMAVAALCLSAVPANGADVSPQLQYALDYEMTVTHYFKEKEEYHDAKTRDLGLDQLHTRLVVDRENEMQKVGSLKHSMCERRYSPKIDIFKRELNSQIVNDLSEQAKRHYSGRPKTIANELSLMGDLRMIKILMITPCSMKLYHPDHQPKASNIGK